MSLRNRLARSWSTYQKRRGERREREQQLKVRVEEARLKGYERGAIARAKTEGYRQGKGTGGKSDGWSSKLAGVGVAGNRALDFLNMDFGETPRQPSKHSRRKGKSSTRKRKKQQGIFDLF